MKTKKNSVTTVTLALCTAVLLSLTGCSSGVSQEEFDRVNAELESATAELAEITESYNDLKAEYDALLAEAAEGKPVDEVDADFLTALCDGLNERLSLSSASPLLLDKNGLTSAELRHIDQFYNESFADPELGEWANAYIDGVREQKDSINLPTVHEQDFGWTDGLVNRVHALQSIYEKYPNAFESVPTFELDYIQTIPDSETSLAKIVSVNEDFAAMTSVDPSFDGEYEYSYNYTNNTGEQVTVRLLINYYDSNDVRINQNEQIASNIQPGETVKISFFNIEENPAYMTFDWEVLG